MDDFDQDFELDQDDDFELDDLPEDEPEFDVDDIDTFDPEEDEMELEDQDDLTTDSDLDTDDSSGSDNDSDLETDDEELDDQDDLEDEEDEDYQGNIRTVRGAHLVYKRMTEDGTYDELWIYNVGKNKPAEQKIRNAILAGAGTSDGVGEEGAEAKQPETYTVGNVQYIKLTGLPN